MKLNLTYIHLSAILLILLLLSNSLKGQFIVEAVKYGAITKKEIKYKEAEEIKADLEYNNKDLLSEINKLDIEIQSYKRINTQQGKTIISLQNIVIDLNEQLKNSNKKYDDLLDNYLSLVDTLMAKNKLIHKQDLIIQAKTYEIKDIKQELDNLKRHLAQKPPNWSTAFLNKHKTVKNGYILTITANTSNFEAYLDQQRTTCSNVKIVAIMEDILLEDMQMIGNIMDIGDGEFKYSYVTISETNKLKLYFITPLPLRKYKYIYPIITFYLECNGSKTEQLAIIDNVKIHR